MARRVWQRLPEPDDWSPWRRQVLWIGLEIWIVIGAVLFIAGVPMLGGVGVWGPFH